MFKSYHEPIGKAQVCSGSTLIQIQSIADVLPMSLLERSYHGKHIHASKRLPRINMDGKGRRTNNIMLERLWRSVKYEEAYLKEYESVAEFIAPD